LHPIKSRSVMHTFALNPETQHQIGSSDLRPPNGQLPHVLGCRPRLSSTAHPHRPSSLRLQSEPSQTPVYRSHIMKQLYKKTKNSVKDLLRPPSRQSVPTSPARSARASQDASSAHERGTPAVSPTAADASQSAVAQTPSAATSPDTHGLEVPAHDPSPPAGTATYTPAAYAQPPSSHSNLATAGSICNDLLTVVHGASDAFPPLKSALGGILEIWKQCEVCDPSLHDLSSLSNCSFRELPRLKKSSES